MPPAHADKPPGIQTLLDEIMALAIRLRQGIAHGKQELPPGGQQVLEVLLRHGDQTVPQIARLRGTSRQNIQILVNHLRAGGCVDLVGNPSHKRSRLVCATQKGEKLLLAARRVDDASLTMLASLVPATDIASTIAILRRIRQTFGGSNLALPSKNPLQAKVKKKAAPRPKAPAAAETSIDDNAFPMNLL